jgi:hypothetical protein
MKEHKWLFTLPVLVFCFIGIFFTGFEKARTAEAEVQKIHQAAEAALGNYLKEQVISRVYYNSLPINYDNNRCIIGCRVDSADESGVKHWTGFDILLRRENKIWKATIVSIDNHPPFLKQYQKIAPWDYFFRSAKRNGAAK